MRTALPANAPQTRSHRPRALTVFVAAFVAGAAAAVGVNRTLDVRLAQSKPRVESEAIFVALRSLPQGSPVTVWDVALRDWPKAMLPTTALRASDSFSGHVLKHPLREGQPLLSIQLTPSGQGTQPTTEPTPFPPPAAYTHSAVPAADADLWSAPVALQPQQIAGPAAAPAEAVPVQETVTQQDIAPPAEPVAVQEPVQEAVPVSEPVAVPPAASVAITADQPIIADQPITDSTAITDSDIAGMPEAAPEHVVAATTTAVVEPTPEMATVPEPQVPTPADSTDFAGMHVPTPATLTDIAPAVVTPETAPTVAPLPIASSQPTFAPPLAPVDRPRPTQTRFLVVPERIAVQADASFVARATAQPSETNAQTNAQTNAMRPTGRPTSNAVQPLPSTATVERRPQGRQAGNSPQGRQPQRQGRQAAPATTGAAPETPPQPRLGMTIFPNVSAGIDALESRMRSDPPKHGETPAAAQAKPVTVR